jgi:hypothetical protein
MALPDYSGGSGFYDPQATYNSVFGNTNVRTDIPGLYQTWGTDDNAEGVFQERLSALGLGGLGSRARTAQQLYGQAQAGYKTALTKNYNMMFPEYLDQTNLSDIFNNMSYEQQGLDPNRFGQGKYRWGQRPG